MSGVLTALQQLGLPGGVGVGRMPDPSMRMLINRPSSPDGAVIEILTDPDERDVQQVIIYWRGPSLLDGQPDVTRTDLVEGVLVELISRIVGPKGWAVPLNEVRIMSGSVHDTRSLTLVRDLAYETRPRATMTARHTVTILPGHPRYCPAREQHEAHPFAYAYLATDGLRTGGYECDGTPVAAFEVGRR